MLLVDNESAKWSLIRGYSSVDASAEILGAIGVKDAELGSFDFYQRVPTEANLADGPSRRSFDLVVSLFDACVVDPVFCLALYICA